MSDPGPVPAGPVPAAVVLRVGGGRRQVLAGSVFLVLALLAAAVFVQDLRARGRALAVAEALDPFEKSAVLKTMGLQGRAELAGAVALEAALRTGDGSLPRAALQDLALRSVVARPGRAYDRFLLARVAFGSAPANAATWRTCARLAAEGASGMDAVWEWMANRYLEAWPRLTPSEREAAMTVLRRAFLDPAYVGQMYRAVTTHFSQAEADGLIPDEPDSLRAALDVLPPGTGDPLRGKLESRLQRLPVEESGVR